MIDSIHLLKKALSLIPAGKLTKMNPFYNALRIARDNLDAQNFYNWNPAFDRKKNF